MSEDSAAGPVTSTPILPAVNLEESMAFYRGLGFEVEGFDPGYAFVLHGGREVLHLRLVPGLDAEANRASAYLHVPDVDAWHRRWHTAGVAVDDVADRPWGMREFSVLDPSGALIRVGTRVDASAAPRRVEVSRVGYVGTRTADVAATTAFFRDVLGLDAAREDDGWSILQLPTGRFDFLEVYGEDFDEERLFPSGVRLAVGLVVSDVEEAHAAVRAAGIACTEPVWASEVFDQPELAGYGWCFVTAPDGHTYVLQQVPD